MQKMENVYEITSQTKQGSEMNKTQGAKTEGLADLGKFKDVNALMQAYQSLQAEFTRRSQRLKRYEEADNLDGKEKELCEKKDATADAPELLGERPASVTEEKVETVKTNGGECPDCKSEDDEQISVMHEEGTPKRERVEITPTASLYEQVMANEEVRLKIVGDYLSSVGKTAAPLSTGSVGVLTSPVKKAGSISEAGRFALAFLQSGKQEK